MAAIQSLGVGSGLLTSDLIDKIIASERNDTDARMTTKKAELDAKVSAFGTIKSSVDSLRTAAKALGDASTLLINTATSSDPSSVGASATNKAQSGVHSVEVTALARAHTLASKRYSDITSVVGSGTLTFNFGTTTFANDGTYRTFTPNPARQSASIVIDDTNDTLQGVRDAINAADIGVTANIVNDGSGFRLVLAADDLGASNSMQINATEGATAGLSAIAFNAGASTADTNMTQTVAAADAAAVIDGIPITRTTNTINDVVTGLTFNLQATNAGSPAVVTVAQDTSGIATKMQAFVDAFNDVRALTDKLTAYDATNNQPSLLTGDPTVLSIRNQMQRLLSVSVSGASVKSLVDLGVTSDQDNQYFLAFDQSKLTAALTKDPTGVQALLASQTGATDGAVNVVGFTSKTTAGSYAVDVSQLATHGTTVGASPGAGAFAPITIGDGNDDLTVSIDGVATGAIKLTHGVYATGAALAKELQTQINADSTLQAANVSASVSFNATDNHFEIASTRYGSASSVGIDTVDTDTLATLGFTVGAAQVGLNVAGTINGVAATGNGQFLAAPNGPLPAMSGFAQGAAIAADFTTPLVIDATNDNFSVRVDGVASGPITLTDGNYTTGDSLATEIQTRINADSALVAGGVSVSVKYDAAQRRFTVTSASKGASSSVGFTTIAAGVTAALGFGVGLGTNGRDAASVADASAGLSVQITGGPLGDRGTVSLVRGVMNRIDQTWTNAVSVGGMFDTQQASFDAQEKRLADDQDAFNKRMTALQTRLQTQFAAADALISKLNSTSSYLSQQLNMLPLSNTNTKKS
jgi:flagellar hook-associated protein 2